MLARPLFAGLFAVRLLRSKADKISYKRLFIPSCVVSGVAKFGQTRAQKTRCHRCLHSIGCWLGVRLFEALRVQLRERIDFLFQISVQIFGFGVWL